MKRRNFLQTTTLGCAVVISKPAAAFATEDPASELPHWSPKEFELDELSISDLQDGMRTGRFTSHSLARKYLGHIDEVDKSGPQVNSIIEINPEALSIADSLDRERKEKGARGPLHGIPILIKDNIDTGDQMMTTAGSLALLGSHALRDSFVAKKLREAGAVILGKTNLSEWANI